ncbi:Homeobox-leucine zipper family protein / lipid-binding START domain-containing protein [Perilla frutescens var. hirtella]|uniref:Homeobox-leucine zipper family protein / lipid-binding START domain-containing protein n=1 Tax=Perilla frutescens var. hirtella TaxID=608512 RepID=A0AAD4JBJ3_PERFH|nr:Homeobox-leucine zipper family protein / lipid-binding START domain-containing protein [Perilla frutescens var. hirtella]
MALSMHRDSNSSGSNSKQQQMDASKYVRYTPEQVDALERVYAECPKPSSLRRQQLIRECPILSNIEPKQIKVWFQNRRCREKQRKEASRLQTVNRKLSAMNKLLMEENDRLQKQVSQLVYENGYMRQQLHTVSSTTDTSCDSVVMSGQPQQQNPTPQHPQRDTNSPAGLLAIAEETLAEFLGKATGTAVDWVQMIGMKPGPDSIGIVAVSRNCSGIAARACGLVSLEPTKVAEILKDRLSWFRDCRCLDVASAIPTGNGGTIELVYMQVYAPTTLASARDFWTLRYITNLEDGSLVICERSLTSSTGGPAGPPTTCFVRAEMLPSGYLIRPCEGGGSIIHIVDHIDFDACSVPEVLRPLYESSKILAQKMTMAALRHIRQIAQETNGEIQYSGGRQPAVLRALSQRLCRGFNDAVNGFVDDGWSIMGSDGVEDVTIAVNSSPSKFLGSQYNNLSMLPTFGGVLCARASMLLQNVPPALLVRFLREHRSEWADYGVDVYSAAALKASPYAVPCSKPGGFPSSQVILPLAQTVEHEEFLEVVRLEGHAFSPEEIALSRDMYLLQLCSGIDETTSGACAQLVFAPIDESFGDDAPLLPSGFRVIPLEPKSDGPAATRTLDLASALEVGHGGARAAGEADTSSQNLRSVLTIAFQFTFENHYRDSVAAMARQYVRSIVASVQRVAMAIAPSQLNSHMVPKPLPGSPEAVTLAQWICRSYSIHTGGELLQADSPAGDAVLKQLWHHSDAIMCCSVKMNASAVFTFANQAGLDMLETTLVALQDIMLEKILDEAGRKILLSEFSKIMQQGFAYLPAGVCVSSMGRPVSYEQAVAWKVLNDDDANHCLAFMFMNWSFV